MTDPVVSSRILESSIIRMEMETDEASNCICQRPFASVVCRNCSFTFSGRKVKICPQHPNVYFFQDHSVCPKCQNSKDYLHEYDSTKNFISKAGFHIKQQ